MSSSSSPFSLMITLLALVFVLVLAWLTLKFLAKLNRNSIGGGRMQVLQSQAVGSRERIVIMKVDDKEYVLGVTANGISVIDAMPSEVASEGAAANKNRIDVP